MLGVAEAIDSRYQSVYTQLMDFCRGIFQSADLAMRRFQ